MKGIDVSAWQTNVDWQGLVDAGCEFVIIKIGQSCKLDDMFVDHINNAVASGLKVGVYYYAQATTEEEAQQEADWIDSQVKQYLNGVNPEMGIWYDVEDQSMEGSDITGVCVAFISQLKGAGYSYIGVYASYNWLTNGNISPDQLPVDTPYWCAQYNSECDFNNPNLKIWQYTDSLSIAGSNFDGNKYFE